MTCWRDFLAGDRAHHSVVASRANSVGGEVAGHGNGRVGGVEMDNPGAVAEGLRCEGRWKLGEEILQGGVSGAGEIDTQSSEVALQGVDVKVLPGDRARKQP